MKADSYRRHAQRKVQGEQEVGYFDWQIAYLVSWHTVADASAVAFHPYLTLPLRQEGAEDHEQDFAMSYLHWMHQMNAPTVRSVSHHDGDAVCDEQSHSHYLETVVRFQPMVVTGHYIVPPSCVHR